VRCRLLWVLVLSGLMSFTLALPLQANVGNPTNAGTVVGELHGLGQTVVESEIIDIDLTPLADGGEEGMVKVYVVYEFRHDGPRMRMRPLFVTGASGVIDFEALLDERPIRSRAKPGASVPQAWSRPTSTPDFDGGEIELETDSEQTPIELDFEMPPGKSTLKVSYLVQPTISKLEGPTLLYQFAYVLAPARTWGGFKDLTVTVTAPVGWDIATTPALRLESPFDALNSDVPVVNAATGMPITREEIQAEIDESGPPSEQRYIGHFATLPADTLAITAQARPGAEYQTLRWATLACFALAVFGGIAFCRLLARAKAPRIRAVRAGESSRHGVPVWMYALGAGVIWGLAVAHTGFMAIYAPGHFLPEGQGYRYGYGQGLAILAVSALSVLCVFVGWVATWWLTARQSRRSG
jgi:hypothetical protein